MYELPLVFVAGLTGSAHCIGMCGPIAIALAGGSRSWRHNLGRQFVYTLGRAFTYSVLGALAGFGGWRLARLAPMLTHTGAVLAILAGVVLVYQGLESAGVLPKRYFGSVQPCLASDFLRSMLRLPGLRGVFLAGLFTGLIPCGLVYGFLALAVATANPWHGAGLMIAFGLGTAPAMLGVGCGGSLLSVLARRHVLQLAAWCVVLAGVISIARGTGYLPLHGADASAGCPLCH
jgi:sulfite exporter TauE/SafE